VTAGCARDHSVGAVDEFVYFMIRIRRTAGKGSDADPLTGVIERLGSGEKSEFAGPEALVKLVHAWSLPAEPTRTSPSWWSS